MIPDIGRGGVHLLGIAGTAMASLAGLLKGSGYRVTGSDQNVYPPMSDVLAELGVDVRSPYDAQNVPEDCDLVVVGNALSRGNPELEAVLERTLPYVSMPELVKELYLRRRSPLVVAGTHGKTTTSSIAAWLLTSAGRDPGFLVGGVPLNFGASYHHGTGEPFVIEGDEYDTAYFDKGPKFLHYLPRVAILGNVEFDHADIYRDVEDVERAFRLFVNLIPRSGLLVVGSESERARKIAESAPCPVTTFGVAGDVDWSVDVRSSDETGSDFRILRGGTVFADANGPFWGDAGFRNVLAAVAATSSFGLTGAELSEGLSSFQGVRRRLELRGTARGVTVVDDFAHHPSAIAATLRAARARFAGRRLWGIFEPRSFTTRSNVFQGELATALAHADAVVLSAVFRSPRLAEEDELSEEQLIADLTGAGTDAWFLPGPDDIVKHLADEVKEGDVVLVMSNGGFGGLHEKLLSELAA